MYLCRSGNYVFNNKNFRGRPKNVKFKVRGSPKIVFRDSVILAKEYKNNEGVPNTNVMGWWMSEKYDGYRAVWNGKHFLSRNKNRFYVPNWFSSIMPKGVSLDGEFWLGRGNFEKCGLFRRKIPKTKIEKENWEKFWANSGVIYKVFDIPHMDNSPFEKRMEKLQTIINRQLFTKFTLPKLLNFPLQLTEQIKINSRDQLEDKFRDILQKGGEGVILKEPGSFYINGRSSSMLKYKEQGDMECKIIGYREGTGRNSKKIGSFLCSLLDSNVEFIVGGINDTIRKNYKKNFPIDTIITIQYNGFTGTGKPRHARYMRRRYKV